jgi:hypothetical protein
VELTRVRPAEVQHPAHHVEHVDAHVADDAVAVLHEGPPAARVDELVVGPHRRRAGPHLVVEVLGGSVSGGILAGPHVVVAVDLDQPDLAELALLDDPSRASIRCGVLRRCVPTCTTRPYLRAAASIAWPSTDVHADRLLHVDVGARPRTARSSAARASGPAWRSGRCRGPSRLEHLAVVAVGARALLRGLPRRRRCRRPRRASAVDVAQRDDLDRRDLDQPEQVALAVPAGPDQAGRGGPS